jgi:hypothetical protein
MSKYKIFFLLLGALFLISNDALSQNPTGSKTTQLEQSEIEALLIENSKKLNRNLPVMIDSQTRLDTTFATGMTMNYKSTLINLDSNQVDTDFFRNELKSQLIKSLRSDEGAMFLMRVGVTIIYRYFDKNGVLITSLRLNAASFGME